MSGGGDDGQRDCPIAVWWKNLSTPYDIVVSIHTYIVTISRKGALGAGRPSCWVQKKYNDKYRVTNVHYTIYTHNNSYIILFPTKLAKCRGIHLYTVVWRTGVIIYNIMMFYIEYSTIYTFII